MVKLQNKEVMTSELIEVTPDPARITESLRDTGYVLNDAVADIVDNSIAAGATKVQIDLHLDPRGRVRFSIADNGAGMNQEGLVNALRYGSKRREDPSSLGKFGLGLKTASTAFARRIRVTSRNQTSEALAAIWDLDNVKKIGWKVEVTETIIPEDLKKLDAVSPSSSGTIVRWEEVDRVIRQYKDPKGIHAKNAMKKVISTLSDHLSMVFQRFLDTSDDRATNVEFILNNKKVEPWNPFDFGAECLFEDNVPIEVPDSDEAAILALRAFVMPRRQDIIADLGKEGYAEARLTNSYQGIYVYRENRLIHGPDWLGFWMQEPHSTLSRIELSFDHKLDEAFQIDIKKSRILLDTALEEYIKKAISGPRSVASQIYRDRQVEATVEADSEEIHKASNATIEDKQGSIPGPEIKSTDEENRKTTITNPSGTTTVPWSPSMDQRVFVETVPFVQDGMLYEPTYIGKNMGVHINKSHQFYSKVYLANQGKSTTIQALDSVLWALATAELKVTDDQIRKTFNLMRYDISRTLRLLVEDLPDYEASESE